MVKPPQAPAFALPVPDRVVDEIQLGGSPEVRNGKNGIKDRLQTEIFALGGQKVHLQKAIVGAPLHLDQIRNLDDGWDFGEINPTRQTTVDAVWHSLYSSPGFSKGFVLRKTRTLFCLDA